MVLCLYRGRDYEDFNSILCLFEPFLERKKDFAIVHSFLNEREGISLYSGTTT